MASTAHKNPEMMAEFEEDLQSLEKKAKTVASYLLQGKHAIAFTGAGVSTSAGIPDFRGPEGVWTLQAEGRARTAPTTSTLKAIPTPTHMALLRLIEEGYLKFLVSQNTDGLHRRSGVPPDKIAELHGNQNLEICKDCCAQYLRDYSTRRPGNAVTNHETGRFCSKCAHELHDSIINFGEPLPRSEIMKAFEHAQKADVCLTLGSSLTVSPAADIPGMVGKANYQGDKSRHLIICNLQRTPLDPYSDVRVHSKTDTFMELLMKEMNLDIPEWRLRRQVLVTQTTQDDKTVLTVAGVDVDGTPVSIFKQVEFQAGSHHGVAISEPLSIRLLRLPAEFELGIKFTFFGHYNEPEFVLPYTVLPVENSSQIFRFSYNPFQRKWNYSGAPVMSQ